MPAKKYWRPFAEARAYARSLGLKNSDDWNKKHWKTNERPSDIPSSPSVTYGAAWTSWEDFLGDSYKGQEKKSCRPFQEARAYVRGLGLTSSADWAKHWKTNERPSDIPRSPDQTYGAAWTSWEDFLGDSYGDRSTRNQSKRPIEEARAYALGLGHTTSSDWAKHWKTNERPSDIPSTPARA